MGNITVKTSENLFLTYTLLHYLNHLNLRVPSPDYHFLCRKTVDHFSKFDIKINLSIDEYIHHSKPVTYALTLDEPPSFTQKKIGLQDQFMQEDIEKGAIIHDALVKFYNETDFSDYYKSILPFYNEEVKFIQEIIDRKDLNSHLNEIWTVDDYEFQMEVILMPLEGKGSGLGPSINNVSYQIVGPPFNIENMYAIVHEASHPRAKKIMNSHLDEIEELSKLFERLKNNAKFPKSYTIWRTAFEEHLVRTVQLALVEDYYQIYPADLILSNELKNKGMEYIYDFYEVINAHVNGDYRMDDIILKILDRLKEKYL